MKNKKLIVVIIIITALLVACLFAILFAKPKTIITDSAPPETPPTPVAYFEGGKSKEFYDSLSQTNYRAAQNIVGDFLLNHESCGSNNIANSSVKEFSTEYGDNFEYITNFTFTCVTNKKQYDAKIVNSLNNSKSSSIIVTGYNYEKTFGDIIN